MICAAWTAREQAVERLQKSVQGYQDDRDRLAEAYRRLAVSLGRSTDDSAVESTADWRRSPPVAPPSPGSDPPRERRAEGRPGKDDGDDRGLSVCSSADGSGP